MLTLQIITASTRPSRLGPKVAAWFVEAARAHGKLEIEPIDLGELNLPLFNEPEHPSLRHYHHPHTRDWSAKIQRADAFVFVTPEYNHFPPPSLINALDYLYTEWNHKPAGFVSYGGLSGGIRSAEAIKPLITALEMVPLADAVILPFFAKQISADGRFQPTPSQEKSAVEMLDALLLWATALKSLRQAAAP